MPARDIGRSRFHAAFLRHVERTQVGGSSRGAEPSTLAILAACRPARIGPFEESHVALFEELIPHVTHAVRMRQALETAAGRAHLLEHALDGAVSSVFVVGADLRVQWMNRAAAERTRRGDGLRMHEGRLRATGVGTTRGLAAILGAALAAGRAEAELSSVDGADPVWALLIPRGSARRPLEALARPLGRTSGAVLLTVGDPDLLARPSTELLSRLHGLTPGEARVVIVIADGLSVSEAADELGLSPNTVKTHLRHAFVKTGSRRQADLVRLIERLSGFAAGGAPAGSR